MEKLSKGTTFEKRLEEVKGENHVAFSVVEHFR